MGADGAAADGGVVGAIPSALVGADDAVLDPPPHPVASSASTHPIGSSLDDVDILGITFCRGRW